MNSSGSSPQKTGELSKAKGIPLNWRVIGASVEGSRHRSQGLPCDDSHGYRQRAGLLLLAVADGAGSAELGGLGARLAVETVLDALMNSLDEPVENLETPLRQAFRTARHLLKAEAQVQQKPLREFATTLLVAVVAQGCTVAAQIGDGAIVGRSTNQWKLLTQPHKGEHVNETVFLTTPNFQRFISVQTIHDPLEALMLFTDGLEGIALNLSLQQPHPPFFNALLRFAQRQDPVSELEAQLGQELASAAIEARTDDDKTLLIALT